MTRRTRRWWVAVGMAVVVASGNEVGPGIVWAQEPVAGAPPAPAALSQTISLELKGVDVIEVLKLLAKQTGLNIVTGANVRGTVTLFVRDVDVWDAFQIIIETNDLAYERVGDIVKVVTAREYEEVYGKPFRDRTAVEVVPLRYAKPVDVSRVLNQLKTRLGRVVVDETSNLVILIDTPEANAHMLSAIEELDLPTVTKVFPLNYAKATEVKAKLDPIVSKGTGRVELDERTNKVIVTDTVQNLPLIEEVILAVDEKDKQVLIDGKIMEVKLNDDYGLGVNWSQLLAPGKEREVTFSTSLDSIDISDPGSTLTIGPTAKDFHSTVNLIRRLGETNTLSSPRILVVNNQEAHVLVGTKEAYVSQTTTATASGVATTADQVDFVEVGVSLTVTPTINDEGYITMKVKPEVSSVSSTLFLGATDPKNPSTTSRTSIPIVTTSEATTVVAVRDGQTVLIAGLIKDTEGEKTDRLPLLGGIPLLGAAFRSSSATRTKSEIIVFLTPHIVQGDEVSPELERFPGAKPFPKPRPAGPPSRSFHREQRPPG